MNCYLAALDIGSTTSKLVITDESRHLIFSRYRRHLARIKDTARAILNEALHELGDVKLDLALTGSPGMGIAEVFHLPFVQEVIASAHFIGKHYPETGTFIEIGGEDSKIIFFDEIYRPDIHMNGTCAGGTGSFIDQMATLLAVETSELDALATKSTTTYPIATRCGVFAKTDIQALLSRNVSREDIAASIFRAVAVQVVSALSHGREIKKKVIFGGGPLTFHSGLRQAFTNILSLNSTDVIILEHPELIPALGTSMLRNGDSGYRISQILSMVENKSALPEESEKRLPPLFTNKDEYNVWLHRHERHHVPKIDICKVEENEFFLGIDSGSTTTKIVLMDQKGRLILSDYRANNGNPIQAVKMGLAAIAQKANAVALQPRIMRAGATGYGESLIRAAFGLHDGVVETIAHHKAAQYFDPDVSFILDIGGQDMKAVFIRDQAIAEIQVNEACSSGCGSFIETFARTLGYSIQEFAASACESKIPFDLGTRCTVFMNSRVKQALQVGASVSDISAGLAYSVIKNALYKVLKLQDGTSLGTHVVVQGGTFRNAAVLRALENLLGREVIRPDIPELMGAYGVALVALENHRKIRSTTCCQQSSHGKKLGKVVEEKVARWLSLEELQQGCDFSKEELHCNGCENKCSVSKLIFKTGKYFFTGNRCERFFNNTCKINFKERNLADVQLNLLFQQNLEPKQAPILTYGIPRCLNIYENFPFWYTFLTTCGFKAKLSSESSFSLFTKGMSTIMSENICAPAKIAHGHIVDLVEKKVDRIFYPTVVYEQKEYLGAINTFNCPVVTGYPDLLKSAINPESKAGIPLDSPAVSFKHIDRLKDQLYLFFRQFGVQYGTLASGVEKGLDAQILYKKQLRAKAKTLLRNAQTEGRMIVVVAGRPYHIDPLINHGISNLLCEFGVDVISETAIPLDEQDTSLHDTDVLTQWSYSNRLYAAADWVAQTHNALMVQLTSFGCGLDTVATDEVKTILHRGGKHLTLIKMDEITNLGAVKIRLRSMLAATGQNNGKMIPYTATSKKIHSTSELTRKRTLLVPYFSPFYSPLVPAAFRPLGYQVEVLPPQDKASIDCGLRVINNDMCYPAVLVGGDIIKAFQTGCYDPETHAVVLVQSGGQCRASSYVSLVRKGLAAAGLSEVPVFVISNDEITPQPGFAIDKAGLIRRMALGVIFADPLARMYLASLAREKEPGTSKALHTKYLTTLQIGIELADFSFLIKQLQEAVIEFNRIEIIDEKIPRIGIVGEIFVKYNFFAGGNIIDWLYVQGVEVVLSPLQNFFAQRFINEAYNQKAFFRRSITARIKYRLLENYSGYHLGQIEQVMQGFRFHSKIYGLRELANITEEIVSLANQSGEGWLLTAEMIAMLLDGTENIVCLQPFGCISNHITGKGIENKLKEMFPQLHLLSLDMDAGTSEINILNRLHLLVSSAREQASLVKKVSPESKSFSSYTMSSEYSPVLRTQNNYTSLEVERLRAWLSGLRVWEKARHMRHRIGL